MKLRQKVMYMLAGSLLVVLGQLTSNIIDVTAQTTRYTTSRSSVAVYEYYPSTLADTGFLLNKDGFLDGRKFLDKWNNIQQDDN